MKIVCEKCGTSFKLDDSLVKPEGTKVRCSVCKNVFKVYPPKVEAEKDREVSREQDKPDTEEIPAKEDKDQPEASGQEGSDDLVADSKAPFDDSDDKEEGQEENIGGSRENLPKDDATSKKEEAQGPSEGFKMDESPWEEDEEGESPWEEDDTPTGESFDDEEETETKEEEKGDDTTEEERPEKIEDEEDTEDTTDEEDNDEEGQESDKKRASFFSRSLIIFVIIFGLLAAGTFVVYRIYYPHRDFHLSLGKKAKESRKKKEKKIDPGREHLSLESVSGFFVSSYNAGRLFVIKGVVRNNYPGNRSFIRVRGTIFDDKGKPVRKKDVYAGNVYGKNELTALTLVEIKKGSLNKFGKDNKNVDIQPAGSVPFMIIFYDLPDNISEFTVEPLGSVPANSATKGDIEP